MPTPRAATLMRPSSRPPSACCKPAPLVAADQPVGRDRVVVEDQLGGIDALVAELFELAADREARALLGEEQAHAAVPRLGGRVGLDQQREALAVDAVGDPGLGAVDHVVGRRRAAPTVRIACRSVPQSGSVSASAAAQLAGREARQECLPSAPRCRSAATAAAMIRCELKMPASDIHTVEMRSTIFA